MVEVYDKDRRRVAILENAYRVKEDQKINAIWYLYFSLPMDDSKTAYCQPYNYVRADGGELYRIMPSTEEIEETGGIQYQCEHVLATLLDNVLFGYHVVGNRGVYTADCIRYVLDHQLSKNWVLGTCEFYRQFEYGWEQESLLSALFSIASPLSGYMWETDTTSYPWTLNLLDIGARTKPELYVRHEWNMLSFESSTDTQQICTRLYPLGYGEGVNQLSIASINNGVPYIQSPKEYIDRYGIVERIWIDRRYEDVDSLKSAAEVMLSELQEPVRRFEIEFAEIDSSSYNTASIGKRLRIEHPVTGELIDTYITAIDFDRDDVPESKITVANRSTDIATSVANMADRQRIEQAYSQGATQLYAQSLQANCDSKNGAVLSFYIPQEMRIINKVEAKIRVSSFRSYSKATDIQESNVYTSAGGGGATYSSTSGGGSTQTTTAGGGQTSSATSIESSNVLPNETSGQAVHNHGLAASTRLAIADENNNITGSVRWVPSGAHTHPEHTHDIADHSHNVSTPAHSHSVTLPDHSHQLTIPAHSHDIAPGIYFYGYPKRFDLYVCGKKRQSIETADVEIDITQYLVNEDNMIPRGQWLSVEVRPDDLAYASIDLYVQGFVQSRGDKTL